MRITKHKATDSGIELTPKLPSLNDTQQSCIVVDTPGSVVTDMLTAINTWRGWKKLAYYYFGVTYFGVT